MGACGHVALLPMRLYTSWDCGAFVDRSRADAENHQGMVPRRGRYKATFAEHTPAMCNAITAAYMQTRVPSRSIADHLGVSVDVDRCKWQCFAIIAGFYTEMVDVQGVIDRIRDTWVGIDTALPPVGIVDVKWTTRGR